MAAVNDIKETLTWIGRLVVGALIIATYNKVDADHDKNLVQDGQLAGHETRISNLEKTGKEVSYFLPRCEAILPESDIKPKMEK